MEHSVLLFLFHIPVNCALDSGFSCFNSFPLSSVERVTTRTWSFKSVIANFVAWLTAALDITQFADHDIIRLISQLSNDISRVFRKLLKFFNETIISTFLVPSSTVEPVIFCLNFRFRSTITRKMNRIIWCKSIINKQKRIWFFNTLFIEIYKVLKVNISRIMGYNLFKFSFIWNFYNKICAEFSLISFGWAK